MFRNSELSTEGWGHSASSSLLWTYPDARKRHGFGIGPVAGRRAASML
jgi:hypothetical protein